MYKQMTDWLTPNQELEEGSEKPPLYHHTPSLQWQLMRNLPLAKKAHHHCKCKLLFLSLCVMLWQRQMYHTGSVPSVEMNSLQRRHLWKRDAIITFTWAAWQHTVYIGSKWNKRLFLEQSLRRNRSVHSVRPKDLLLILLLFYTGSTRRSYLGRLPSLSFILRR